MMPAMETILLASYLLILACRQILRWLNLNHLRRHGDEVPPGFEGAVDPSTLEKTSAYTLALSRLGFIESLAGSLLVILFFFGGLLPAYDRWIASLTDSFISAGILFILGLTLAQALLGIPFSLYRTFRIENRFGFNTTSMRLWISDLLKEAVISGVLLSLLAGGGLWLVRISPGLWWLWVWIFFALVTLFLMYLSPYVIEPLFFKFEPVRDEELRKEIGELMAGAGLQVSKVQQVDASRRSRHSNAYFTGIGRVKRIVLFDTLLEQMGRGEILGVLAHEAGHWKKGHILKRILLTEAVALAVLFGAHRLIAWGGLPHLFGLDEASFLAQVMLLLFLVSLARFFLTPFSSSLSRRQEWEADRFAVELTGNPGSLASALVKLSRENLANLHPHPLYAWFYFSHPPMAQRVKTLLDAGRGG